MSQKTDTFIATLAPIARNEYLSRSKWVLPSVCIAQAALESGWNLNAKTLFGIKGSGFKATTSEYYNGHYAQITASFKSYPTVASAVVGYFDLITKNPRYAKAVNNRDYEATIKAIKDGGYATDPSYVSKIVSIINQYGLLKYDARTQAQPAQPTKSNEQVADEVIAGKWGVNPARATALKNAGYDPNTIQQIVNYKLGTTKAKSNTEIAREVIAGKWGKGAERRRMLTANGYDYNAIQRIVNSLLK